MAGRLRALDRSHARGAVFAGAATYTVYSVINGLMAHTFAFSVPMALVIKRLLR